MTAASLERKRATLLVDGTLDLRPFSRQPEPDKVLSASPPALKDVKIYSIRHFAPAISDVPAALIAPNIIAKKTLKKVRPVI